MCIYVWSGDRSVGRAVGPLGGRAARFGSGSADPVHGPNSADGSAPDGPDPTGDGLHLFFTTSRTLNLLTQLSGNENDTEIAAAAAGAASATGSLKTAIKTVVKLGTVAEAAAPAESAPVSI